MISKSRLLNSFLLLVTCGLFLRAEDSGAKLEQIIQLKKVISAKCSTKYTSDCFLLDLCKVIDNLNSANKYKIFPGIYLVSNKSETTPTDVFKQAVTHNQSEQLDFYVRKKLRAYLDSLSITWQIMDRDSAFNVRQISDDLITQLLPVSDVGRGKKKDNKDSAMWVAGALAALGSSALFALTGKAAVASLAALLLSMICYFRGQGGVSPYTASAAYVAPIKHQCTEAVIDVNGRGDYSTAVTGHKKRTTEDNWNYPRYAHTSSEILTNTEQSVFRENENTYSKLYSVSTK